MKETVGRPPSVCTAVSAHQMYPVFHPQDYPPSQGQGTDGEHWLSRIVDALRGNNIVNFFISRNGQSPLDIMPDLFATYLVDNEKAHYD